METTHKRLSGDRNQCPSCGFYFNSTTAFDRHRTGEYEKRSRDGEVTPRTRRCLSIEEMTAKGMLENKAGFWITEARKHLPR